MTSEAIWVSAAGGVLVAFVTGLWAWISSRNQSRSDIQKTVNDGFQKLVSELQEELHRRGETESALRRTVSAQDTVIYKLQMRIRKLAHIVSSLHNFIVINGLHPPPYVIEDEETPPP